MAESMGQHGLSGVQDPTATLRRLSCDVRRFDEERYLQLLLEFHRLIGPLTFEQQVYCLHAEADNSNFAPADGPASRRYTYVDTDGRRELRVHLNLGRAQRSGGVGGARLSRHPKPRSGEAPDCHICPSSIAYKSGFRQLYVVHSVNQKELRFLVNPFPLFPGHMTAASLSHEPQSWGPSGDPATPAKIERIVMDVFGVTADLPDSLVMYNGEDAGATIPQHYHLHVMRHRQEDLFPIQRAALVAVRARRFQLISDPVGGSMIEYVDDAEIYPLVFARGVGMAGARAIVGLLQRWVELTPHATANVIAVREQGEVALYLVPRDRRFNRAPGLEGVPGGMEVLGEVVMTSPLEADRIARHELSFETLRTMLRNVRPPDIRLLVSE